MILERFRRWAGTWPAKMILGCLVVGLAVFTGMNDILSGHKGLDVFGKVGDADLISADFKQQLSRRIQLIEKSVGRTLTTEDLIQLRLPTQVINQIVQQTLLDQEAEHLGLVTTDDQIREAISANPIFHNQQGVLDPGRFESFLRAQRMSEHAYVELLRKELRRMQLVEALLAPVQVPQQLVVLLTQARLQKRQGAYAFISAAQQDVKEKPSEQTLRAFHQKYAKSFIQPERRSLTVLVLDQAAATKVLQSSSPAQKDQVQVAGKQIDDALASGETLEEVAKKFGLQLHTLEQLNQRGELQQTKAWPQGLPTSDAFKMLFLKKAFEAEVKEDLPMEWVSGEELAFVVRVDTLTSAQTLPFEAIQEQVWQKWRELRQYQLTFQEAVAIVDQLRKGATPFRQISFTPLPWIQFQDLQKPDAGLQGDLALLKEPLFEMGVGSVRVVPSEKGAYIVKLLHLEQAPETKVQEHLSELTEKASEMLKDDVIQAYVQSLKNRYMVRLNDRVIGAILASFGF